MELFKRNRLEANSFQPNSASVQFEWFSSGVHSIIRGGQLSNL